MARPLTWKACIRLWVLVKFFPTMWSTGNSLKAVGGIFVTSVIAVVMMNAFSARLAMKLTANIGESSSSSSASAVCGDGEVEGVEECDDDDEEDTDMITTGAASPDTGTNNSAAGDEPWVNPQNVTIDDGGFATVSLSSEVSNYLEVTDFDFSIPGDATIDGITATIFRESTGTVTDSALRLLKAGTAVGENKATGVPWSPSEAQDIYGGAADKWGTTWSPSDINSSGFGVQIGAAGLGDASIDTVSMAVSYTTLDGCSVTCTEQDGYDCSGEPSVCEEEADECGNGVMDGSETCDDDDADGGDGCSAACATETGFDCAGTPSVCAAICGDGDILGGDAAFLCDPRYPPRGRRSGRHLRALAPRAHRYPERYCAPR